MLYLIITIILFIILFVILSSITPKIKTQKLYNELNDFLKKSTIDYEIKRIKNDIYDIDLKTSSHHYYIKILIIPNYSEIQINNCTTWEVKYGAGNTPGKAQPHKRYLSEISSFLGAKYSDEIKKMIIVFPKPKKIVKYINESEIIFVNSKTNLYGTRIISKDNFDFFIK